MTEYQEFLEDYRRTWESVMNAGDVTGDGKADVVWRDSVSGTVAFDWSPDGS